MNKDSMKQRQAPLPSEISKWIEKDITLKRVVTGPRLGPNDHRQNFVATREFFSHMLMLSAERYRKLVQYDLEKKTFLKNQRHKAETTMPGLLPYVDQCVEETTRSSMSRSNSFASPSPHMLSARRSKTPQSKPMTPQLERLSRLSQPKGQSPHSASHVRANQVNIITVEQLFGHFDDTKSSKSLSSVDRSKQIVNDQRFHQLMRSCSTVYHRPSSQQDSVKNIVQSNPSLQSDGKGCRLTSDIDHRRRLEKFYNNSIDICA